MRVNSFIYWSEWGYDAERYELYQNWRDFFVDAGFEAYIHKGLVYVEGRYVFIFDDYARWFEMRIDISELNEFLDNRKINSEN